MPYPAPNGLGHAKKGSEQHTPQKRQSKPAGNSYEAPSCCCEDGTSALTIVRSQDQGRAIPGTQWGSGGRKPQRRRSTQAGRSWEEPRCCCVACTTRMLGTFPLDLSPFLGRASLEPPHLPLSPEAPPSLWGCVPMTVAGLGLRGLQLLVVAQSAVERGHSEWGRLGKKALALPWALREKEQLPAEQCRAHGKRRMQHGVKGGVRFMHGHHHFFPLLNDGSSTKSTSHQLF